MSFPAGRVVDLSHSFSEETLYWPTEEGFKLETAWEGVTDKGYFYFANRFRAAEHGGTHVDAPRHFAQKGKTVDEIPLQQLMGDGIQVDVSSKCEADRDYRVTVDDFLAWEKENGPIPEGVVLFLRTGFERFWPNRKRYLGTDERGPEAVKKLHFPGLHPEAARWLVVSRKVKAVGIDTASIDHGPSADFETHVVLGERNIPILENLTNLSELPARGFQVVALPMKIKRGSGGPTRVVAFVS